MTIASRTRTDRHDADAAASVDRTIQLIASGDAAGRDLLARAREGPVGVRRRPRRLRPRLVDGRRDPHRLAAAGRSCRASTATRQRRRARTTASAPRRPTLGDRVVVLGHLYQRDDIIAVRRLPRRLLPARARGADQAGGRVHRLLRRALHGRDRRHPLDARADRHPAEPRRRLLDGRHGRHRRGLRVLGGARGALRRPTPDADGRVPVIPVTYMNSAAALKAFCRRARRHRLHLLERRDGARVGVRARPAGALLPRPAPRPQHGQGDGRPARPDAAVEPAQGARRHDARRARTTPGSSSGTASARVHQRFTVDQIEQARAEHPGVHVIVHPECPMPVVEAADADGSTEFIAKAIAAAPAGSTFAIGTEINLVQRLAAENPQHTIFCLDPVVCPCSTMYRIHPAYLAWVLEALVAGEVVNQITVQRRRGRPGPARPRADARGQAAGQRRRRRARLPSRPAAVPREPDHGARAGDRQRHRRAVRPPCAPPTPGTRSTLVTKGPSSPRATPATRRAASPQRCSPTTPPSAHLADTLARRRRAQRPAAVRVLCDEGPARVRDLIRFGVALRPRRVGPRPRPRGGALARPRPARRRRRHRRRDRARARSTHRAAAAPSPCTSTRCSSTCSSSPATARRVGRCARVIGAGGIRRRPSSAARRRRRARHRRRRAALPAHDQPRGRDRRRRRRRLACRRRASRTSSSCSSTRPRSPCPARRSISEAVRGEGAVLRRRVAASASCSTSTREAELAPRDVVARAICRRDGRAGRRARCCSTRPALGGPRASPSASPAITPRAARPGYDWAREPVPVTPAAHYWMGGVGTDL